MAHQSSVMRAAITRLTPETYPAPEPENKSEEFQSLEEALTGEIKEDPQLEVPSH